jgi:hypothetical protein
LLRERHHLGGGERAVVKANVVGAALQVPDHSVVIEVASDHVGIARVRQISCVGTEDGAAIDPQVEMTAIVGLAEVMPACGDGRGIDLDGTNPCLPHHREGEEDHVTVFGRCHPVERPSEQILGIARAQREEASDRELGRPKIGRIGD